MSAYHENSLLYEGDLQKLCTPFLDEDKEGERCSVNRPSAINPSFLPLHHPSLVLSRLSLSFHLQQLFIDQQIDIMCPDHLILKCFRVDLGTLLHIFPPAHYLGLLKCECVRIPCCRKTKTAFLEEIKNKSRKKKKYTRTVILYCTYTQMAGQSSKK